jgi:hypothetical protein
MRPLLLTALAAVLVQTPAHAQSRGSGNEATFAHPRDIGPRYEPDIEHWWEDYKRTGCMPVPQAVRLPNGRYVVRVKRDCGGSPAARPGQR